MNLHGCEIESYYFMIKTGPGTVRGPIEVKGSSLTPAIIKMIKETKGPGIYVYFDDIHAKYNGKSFIGNAVVIKYDQ